MKTDIFKDIYKVLWCYVELIQDMTVLFQCYDFHIPVCCMKVLSARDTKYLEILNTDQFKIVVDDNRRKESDE